jgi:hypothetical protein
MCADPIAAQAIKSLREDVQEIKNLQLERRLTKLETYFKVVSWLVGLVAPLATSLFNYIFGRILP